jgi:fibronectin type 3 domain-containing protein
LNPIQLVPTNEPPNAPTGLTAEPYDGRLELDWSGAFAAASYTVKRSEQPGGPYDVIATGVPGTRYTDTGLENGKTYFYVVTGVNANGEGTPSAELAAVPNVQNNVALGKTVTASESLELAPDWSVTKLTDGITTSIPGANGYTSHAHASPDLTANPIWLQIDLGEMTTIDRVKLYPRSNTLSADSGAPNFPRDFTIEVSADGVSFITVKTVTGQSHIFWQPPAYTFEPVEARYVRLHVTSVGPPAPDEPANHRLQLAEMEVYEAVPSAGE